MSPRMLGSPMRPWTRGAPLTAAHLDEARRHLSQWADGIDGPGAGSPIRSVPSSTLAVVVGASDGDLAKMRPPRLAVIPRDATPAAKPSERDDESLPAWARLDEYPLTTFAPGANRTPEEIDAIPSAAAATRIAYPSLDWRQVLGVLAAEGASADAVYQSGRRVLSDAVPVGSTIEVYRSGTQLLFDKPAWWSTPFSAIVTRVEDGQLDTLVQPTIEVRPIWRAADNTGDDAAAADVDVRWQEFEGFPAYEERPTGNKIKAFPHPSVWQIIAVPKTAAAFDYEDTDYKGKSPLSDYYSSYKNSKVPVICQYDARDALFVLTTPSVWM